MPRNSIPSSSQSPALLHASPARAWSRRQFLQSATVASIAAPLLFSSRIGEANPRPPSPNAKLNHACIGVGGMGAMDLKNFLQHQRLQIVALCDVDAHTLENAAKQVPGARLYSDWRELLQTKGNKIDSVNVAVPDHSHFSIAYSAIQKGKHVYCQKPLCHDVAEVRLLTETAVKKRVVTQLGTQVASTGNERAAVALIKEGHIGKVTRAYLCSNRPGAVEAYRLVGPRPQSNHQPPPHLNWDLWIGTAPLRPYEPAIYHPAKWRAWQDLGTGWSGDIGCHIFDAVWKGLGLQSPLTISAEVQESWKNSPARRADTWPQGDHITWTFQGNEKTGGEELVLEWFDGDYYPPERVRKLFSNDLTAYPAESSMLIGTEGALLIPHGGVPQLLPQDKFKTIKLPEMPSRNHYHHFVDACLGGEKTESHFAQTGPMTEAILLGTVAIRTPDQSLEWDHARMKIRNETNANKYLKRAYREGWHLAKF